MSLQIGFLSKAAGLFFAVTLTACSSLPQSGPNSASIRSNATSAVKSTVATPYVLVDLNVDVLSYIKNPDPGSIYSSFRGGRGPAPEVPVGVGDAVQVTIFESKSGGLFVPEEAGARPGNYVTLPAQTVNRDGVIRVPYAGLIQVDGRSVSQIEADIESKLITRAIEPQVVVDVTDRQAARVTVTGSVREPTTFDLGPSGTRVLDAISDAGGPADPAYETFVTLRRKGEQATVYYNNLVSSPTENIYLAPGDTIYVYSEKRSFLVFGAAGGQGLVEFNSENVSLLEAVGKSGGLLDSRADPSEVFIYRVEAQSTLADMGADLSKFNPEDTAIPTIYRVNLRDPSGFFVAQLFQMRDKDILYVSNAGYTDVAKFANLITTVTGLPAAVTSDLATTKSAVNSLIH
jgi:polysaccharide export outer membrane protein